MVRSTDVNLAQVASRQAQLEEMVEETNKAIHSIKQLLERLAIPPTQPTIRGQPTVEGLCVEQQVFKATTCGNATLSRSPDRRLSLPT